jgi:hypothetical protein
MVPTDILHRQLSGPLAQAYGQAVIDETQIIAPALDYLESLSLSSTDFQILYDIGLVIGMPWPVFASGSFSSNVFTFGTNAGTYPITTNNAIGLGDTANPLIGGQLYDANSTSTTYIPLNMYQAMLSFVAKTKLYGVTLKNVLALASVLTNSFTVNFNSSKDLEIHYTIDFGAGNRSAIQYALDYVTTAPRFVVSYP